MSWWGKLVGGAVGYMLGGPIGGLIGAALGHNLDRGARERERDAEALARSEFDRRNRTQAAFFTATFSVMGHVAKSDGRVTPDEIDLASALMTHLRLDREMRTVARRLFTQGKDPSFDLDGVLDQFRRECHHSRNLLRMFVELQLQAAYADRTMHPGERVILDRVCDRLGLHREELAEIEALVQASLADRTRGPGPGAPAAPAALAEDYAMLGATPDDSDEEIKRAYRRMMSRHHPDKLVARGLPEEMTRVATERTRQIRSAYERIQRARRG